MLHICLIGSLYEILAKLPAVKLRGVFGKLVSCNQSAFFSRRHISDGVLLVNEVMDIAKKKKKGCLLLKVDYEKAYDGVNWNFLRFLFDKMRFGVWWIRWMEGCVFTSLMLVQVNGDTTKDFKVERGLRQGDSLSMFSFALVMEGLTWLMRQVVEIGEFGGFKINTNEEVSIQHFVDDTIIMAEVSSNNLWSIKVILRGFKLMSRLKVYFFKSKLYGINAGDWFLNVASIILSCSVDKLYFKFLGIIVGDSPRKLSMWKELIKNFMGMLAIWKGRHLSLVG